jgi:hypothetical protein
MSKTDTIVKMAADGALTRVRGGRRSIVKPASPSAMSEAEALAAARADPDNPPLTAQSLASLKPVARVRTLRCGPLPDTGRVRLALPHPPRRPEGLGAGALTTRPACAGLSGGDCARSGACVEGAGGGVGLGWVPDLTRNCPAWPARCLSFLARKTSIRRNRTRVDLWTVQRPGAGVDVPEVGRLLLGE